MRLFPEKLSQETQSTSIFLNDIADLDVQIYVPDQGPLCGKEGLKECREYLLLIYDEGRKRFDPGISVSDAARDIQLGRFKKWGN